MTAARPPALSINLRRVRFEDMISLGAYVLGAKPKYRDGIFNVSLKGASYVSDQSYHSSLNFGKRLRHTPFASVSMVAGNE